MLHNIAGPGALRSFESEVAVLSRLSHPNIVVFYAACHAPTSPAIIEELVDGGSLHNFIHSAGGRRFTYIEILTLCGDVANAMAYLVLHTQQFIVLLVLLCACGLICACREMSP